MKNFTFKTKCAVLLALIAMNFCTAPAFAQINNLGKATDNEKTTNSLKAVNSENSDKALTDNPFGKRPSPMSEVASIQKQSSAKQKKSSVKPITLPRGNTAYGFNIGDDNQSDCLLVSFDVDIPGNLTPITTSEIDLYAGDYYDGLIYTYALSNSGTYSTVDPTTGEITTIATGLSNARFLKDLAYDYTTSTMYGIGPNGSLTSETGLFTIDLATGNVTLVGLSGLGQGTSNHIMTLGCSPEGYLYGISYSTTDGLLYSINKSTGLATLIGSTGVITRYAQSMEFDKNDGTLYWCNCNATDGWLYIVDPATANVTSVGMLGANAEVTCFCVPYSVNNDGAEAPSDFVATPDPDYNLSATLTWTNPSLYLSGAPITNIDSIIIKRGSDNIGFIANPTPGTVSTFVDNAVPVAGTTTYLIYAVTAEGNGQTAVTDAVVGCMPPEVLECTSTTSTTATFTVEGISTAWTIEYGHVGFELGTGTQQYIESSTFTIDNLESGTIYDCYIRTECLLASSFSSWFGPENFTTAVTCPDGYDYNEIVAGNGTTGTLIIPINTYYNYSYTQQIFTAEELSTFGVLVGDIHSIGFQYIHEDAQVKDPITIYMGNVTKAGFESTNDWVLLDELVMVYSGSITFDSSGIDNWVIIPFEHSFTYSGSNLVIAVVNGDGEYTTNDEVTFNSHTASFSSTLYYRNDYDPVDPGSPPAAYQVTSVRNNMRFDMCSIMPDVTIVTGTVSSTLTNQPIANASVYFQGSMGSTVNTDENGEYSIVLAVGFEYNITVSAAGHNTYTESGYFTVQGTSTKNFTLDAPTFEVSPSSLPMTCAYMGQSEASLTISNNGTGTLNWMMSPNYGRSSNSMALIALNGYDLNYFNLDNPGGATPYGTTLEVFGSSAEYYNGTFYCSSYASTELHTIDPETGAVTVVGDGLEYTGGIAYNPLDGIMYGISLGSPSALYTINTETGTETFLVDILGNYYIYGMTITNDGRFLVIDATSGGIGEIDINTGNLSLLIPSGFAISYGQDLACDRETNTPYWAAYNTSAGMPQLYKIDMENLSLELIGNFGGQASCFAIHSDYGWLSADAFNGVIEAGESQNVTFYGNGWWAESGTFSAVADFSADIEMDAPDVPVTLTITNPSCDAPSNLTAELGDWSDVYLSWAAPENANGVTYSLYATETSQIPIASGIESTEYSDLDKPAGIYTYIVRAVWPNGCVSQASNAIEVQTYDCNPENMCEIIIEMEDSYGDGWNGAYILVYNNGDLIGTATVNSGEFSGIKTFTVCAGMMEFIWVEGTYDDECSFVIKNAYDIDLYASSGTPVAGSFFTYQNDCNTTTYAAVTGIITDLATGNPISGALVNYIGVQQLAAISNASGFYVIEPIIGYSYSITVTKDGYNVINEYNFIPSEDVTKNYQMTTPALSVTPNALTIQTEYMVNGTETVTITNTGNGQMTWSALASYNEDADNRVAWDLVASFEVASAGAEQGIASDGNYLYTAFWNSAGEFGKYNLDGTFIEYFDITNVAAIRDLTYDGQYFYGGAGSSTLYKMDFTNKVLVSQVTTQVSAIRHCSYDPANDGFWVGDWSTLYLINREGEIVFTGPTVSSVYGSGYDNATDGGPYLLLYTQPSENAVVRQYNITDNVVTDFYFDCSSIPGYAAGGIAGGAFVGEYQGLICFFGNIQQEPNLVGIYELSSARWLSLSAAQGTLDPDESQEITLTADGSWAEEGAFYATINFYTTNPNVGTASTGVTFIIGDVTDCLIPQNLTVSSQTEGLLLSWGATVNATGYNVYQSDVLIAENISQTTYMVTGISLNEEYCYTVTAVCSGSESEHSGEACGIWTSINELDNLYNVYPNPANTTLFITGENISKIEAYNVLGQKMNPIQVTASDIQKIDIQNYNSGVYIFRIITTEGNSVSKRIIIYQ